VLAAHDVRRYRVVWSGHPRGGGDRLKFLTTCEVDEASATIRLIAGLSNLCGMVLIDLEAATGITPHESLQDLARRIL